MLFRDLIEAVEDLSKKLEDLKSELADIKRKLQAFGPTEKEKDMKKFFPMGAGFGYGTRHSRDKEIDRTVDRAAKIAPLYKRRQELIAFIGRIESGEEAQKQSLKKLRVDSEVALWHRLKVGDTLMSGRIVIKKKNAKSIKTSSGALYKPIELGFSSEASEIIQKGE